MRTAIYLAVLTLVVYIGLNALLLAGCKFYDWLRTRKEERHE